MDRRPLSEGFDVGTPSLFIFRLHMTCPRMSSTLLDVMDQAKTIILKRMM